MKNYFTMRIGNLTITDIDLFYAMANTVKNLSHKFDVGPDDKFLIDLKSAMEKIYKTFDDTSYSIIEREFAKSIRDSESLDKLHFTIQGSDWKIEDFNTKLANNEYTFIRFK